MMVFPSMIAEAAKRAGMQLPEDIEEFDANQFPHWRVYCNVQLGCAVTWGNHWENAKIIAAIPEAELKTLTYWQLEERGFSP